MRRIFPAVIAAAFQLTFLSLFGSVFLGSGVHASEIEAESVVKRSAWNNLASRGEIVVRQTSSGNRTQDLSNFFAPNDPPAVCSVDCESIWGAVSGCDLRSCLCTEQWGHEFVRCVNCLAPNPTSTQKDYYQGMLTEFQSNYCAGFGVPPLVLGAVASGAAAAATGTSPASKTSPTAIPNDGGGPITAAATPVAADSAHSISPHVVTTLLLSCLVSLNIW